MFVLQCEWLYIKIFEPMCSSRKSTIFTRRKEAKRYCFWLSENSGIFTHLAKFSQLAKVDMTTTIRFYKKSFY